MMYQFQLELDRSAFSDSDIGFLREVITEHLALPVHAFNAAFKNPDKLVFQSHDIDEMQGCYLRLQEAGIAAEIKKQKAPQSSVFQA